MILISSVFKVLNPNETNIAPGAVRYVTWLLSQLSQTHLKLTFYEELSKFFQSYSFLRWDHSTCFSV